MIGVGFRPYRAQYFVRPDSPWRFHGLSHFAPLGRTELTPSLRYAVGPTEEGKTPFFRNIASIT